MITSLFFRAASSCDQSDEEGEHPEHHSGDHAYQRALACDLGALAVIVVPDEVEYQADDGEEKPEHSPACGGLFVLAVILLVLIVVEALRRAGVAAAAERVGRCAC